MSSIVKIKKLYKDAKMPVKAHDGDSGFDLFVHTVWRWNREGQELELVNPVENVYTLYSNSSLLIRSGISIALPKGYEAQIRSRSGLALKNQLFVLNSPGTVDEPYRGEIGVVLYNAGETLFGFQVGDRIAQMVVKKVPEVVLLEVDDLDDTERGSGGYGSSGR